MSGGVLATWGPSILGVVFAGGIGGFLKVYFERRIPSATADKTVAEGDAVQSATFKAWADAADARAEKAEAKAAERVAAAERAATEARREAETCRRSAWAAEDAAAQCRRGMEELRSQREDIVERVRACARAGCPLRDVIDTAGGG